MELSVFTIDPKYVNEFTCSNCSSPVFKHVGWNIFLEQCRYFILLLFTIIISFISLINLSRTLCLMKLLYITSLWTESKACEKSINCYVGQYCIHSISHISVSQ